MRKKLFIGIPAFHHVNPEAQITLENLIYRTKKFEVLPVYTLYNQSCIPFARNMIFDKFLASQADFCFMLDADISIRNPNHFDALDKLFRPFDEKKTAGVSGGIYPVKNPPFFAAPLTYVRDSNPLIYEDFSDRPEYFEVKYCASGCMLFSRECANLVGKNPFNLLEHPKKPGEQLSEDFSFCERARQKNLQCYLSTEFELFHTGAYYFSMRDHQSLAKSFNAKIGEDFPPMEISI